jgi:hypothetical protein
VGIGGIVLAEQLDPTASPWGVAAALAGIAVAAGIVAGEVLALYLRLLGGFANRNELFAAQSIEDHKGFVRLRLSPDGTLTVHPLGVEKVPRRWTWTAGASPRFTTEAWSPPVLIEPPIVLEPRRRG